MNHRHHERVYSTCSLKQIMKMILTSDQPLQRLWKVNTFPIFKFFFWKFHNSTNQRMVAGATKLAHLVYLIAWFCISHQ